MMLLTKHLSLAIELELNLKCKSRYRKIINQYQWKEDLYGVIYLLPNLKELNRLRKIWKTYLSGDSKLNVFFITVDDLFQNKAQAKIYFRDQVFYFSNLFTPAHHSVHEVVKENIGIFSNQSELNIQNHTQISEFLN